MPGLRINRGQFGALLNLPWMKLPYFALPENGVSLMVGQQLTIHGDALINVPIHNNLNVTYQSDMGIVTGNNLTINPTSAQIGIHPLVVTFKNRSSLITTKTINLNVLAKAPTGIKKILMIGDSLMNGGASYYKARLDAVLNNCLLTTLGTQGASVKHEGHSGWAWSTFISAGSPFYKNGAVDIASYFTDNSINVPDYVYIMLGINDTMPHCYADGNGLTDAEITGIINNAKTLINAFLAYNANIQIILGIPTITENSGYGWANNYDETYRLQDLFIENIHKYRLAFVTQFANGAFNSRVDCSYEAIYLDRDNGYPKTNGVHNNGVHPDVAGCDQLGNGMAMFINKRLMSDLTPSGLTLSLISGGVKIDWTDNTGGVAQTEIWGKSDNDEYALLYTINAGIVTKSETITPVDLRYYKLRAVSGTWYSDFTPEASIAMLGAELIVNGNFSSWTNDNPNGWSVGESGANIITQANGACRMVTDGTFISLVQIVLTAGHRYRVKCNAIAIGVGGLSLNVGSVEAGKALTVGQKTFFATSDNTTFTIKRNSGATDITFDDVSVKRVLSP